MNAPARDIESILIDAIAVQPLSEVLRIAAAHAEVAANGGEYTPRASDTETARPASGTRIKTTT